MLERGEKSLQRNRHGFSAAQSAASTTVGWCLGGGGGGWGCLYGIRAVLAAGKRDFGGGRGSTHSLELSGGPSCLGTAS